MKRIALFLLFAFCLTGLCLTAAAENPTSEEVTSSGEDIVLNGEYIWSRRDVSGDLKAVFTPTGENQWDVSFYFKFRDEPHTYTGTAEGSLTEGKLSGTAYNGDKRRTWTFEGAVTEGVFEGKHTELTEGREGDAGTMTLKG